MKKEKYPIKLAVSNIAWAKEIDSKIYSLLQSENIQGLEIAPTRIVEKNPYDHLDDAKRKVEMLKQKYDLNVVSMQSIWFGKTENIFENKRNFDLMISYTFKAIDFASAIHCPNIVFGSPKNRKLLNYEEDYPKAISFFTKIGCYAKKKHIVVAIEPNPSIYNTNFLNTTKEAIAFVKQINLESIKVNYDLGTVIYNQESLDILKENIDYINHVHISEPNLLIVTPKRLHKELFALLRKEKYQKYVSIEMKTLENSEDIEKVITYVGGL